MKVYCVSFIPVFTKSSYLYAFELKLSVNLYRQYTRDAAQITEA